MSAQPDSSHAAPLAGAVVFAVDDDENDRVILRGIIESAAPCTCRAFQSGAELLDALIDVLRGAPAPLVCFVDVKMGGMSGLDVLRWIRAQRGLDCIAVVMLSSSEDPQYLAEAQQFGAQCYAAKFPSAAYVREILAAARRYCAEAGCHSAFPLPCNLLVAAHQPAAR